MSMNRRRQSATDDSHSSSVEDGEDDVVGVFRRQWDVRDVGVAGTSVVRG